jgi:hypothetical protein
MSITDYIMEQKNNKGFQNYLHITRRIVQRESRITPNKYHNKVIKIFKKI